MSSQVSWYLENKIIGIRVSDTVTIEDIAAIPGKIMALFEESDAPLIHLLVDQTNITHYPKQFRDVYEAINFMRHQQMGWVIFYGTDNKLLQMVAHLVTELMHLRHRRFSTLAEAQTFLQSVDSTLPDLTEKAWS